MTKMAETDAAVTIVRELIEQRTLPSSVIPPELERALGAGAAATSPALHALEDGEPALSQRALRLANGAFFGTARRARSLVEAADIVGFPVVSASLWTAAALGAFDGKRLVGIQLDRFTSFAVQVGRLAHAFGEPEGVAPAAYAAGTLLDVGTLALSLRHPAAFVSAFEAALTERRHLHDVERERFGIGHPAVGAELLRVWSAPAPVPETVAHHHAPRAAGARSITLACVHSADALLGIVTCRAPEGALDVELLEELHIADRLPDWRAQAREAAAKVMR